MASLNKVSRFLRTSNLIDPESTKEDGYLSPQSRMTTGDKFPHFPLCWLWLIDVHPLFCLGLIPPIRPCSRRPLPVAIRHLVDILPDRTHQFLVLFTRPRLWHFPLGRPLLVSILNPWTRPNPSASLNERWQRMLLPKDRQPASAFKTQEASHQRGLLSVCQCRQLFTYWCFYWGCAQLLESAQCSSRRHR